MSGVGAMQPRDYVTELNLYHQRILTPPNGAHVDNSRANTYECLSDRPPFAWRCWYKPRADSEDYYVTATGAISDRKAQVKQAAAAQALHHIADTAMHKYSVNAKPEPSQIGGAVCGSKSAPVTATAAAAADTIDIVAAADDDGSASPTRNCCSSDDGNDSGTDTPPVPRRPPASLNIQPARTPKRSVWCYYDPFAIVKLARRHTDNGGGQGAWHFCPKPLYEVDQQLHPDGSATYSVCVRWLHRCCATGEVDMERATVTSVATLDVAFFMAAGAALSVKK